MSEMLLFQIKKCHTLTTSCQTASKYCECFFTHFYSWLRSCIETDLLLNIYLDSKKVKHIQRSSVANIVPCVLYLPFKELPYVTTTWQFEMAPDMPSCCHIRIGNTKGRDCERSNTKWQGWQSINLGCSLFMLCVLSPSFYLSLCNGFQYLGFHTGNISKFSTFYDKKKKCSTTNFHEMWMVYTSLVLTQLQNDRIIIWKLTWCEIKTFWEIISSSRPLRRETNFPLNLYN